MPREFYQTEITVSESINYQTIRYGVVYGRELDPGETSEQLKESVETETAYRFNDLRNSLETLKAEIFSK